MFLKELSTEMTNRTPDFRPRSFEILERKKKWAFNKNEIDTDKLSNIILGLSNELFVKSLIQFKLTNLQ
jgi:hypothetical protein